MSLEGYLNPGFFQFPVLVKLIVAALLGGAIGLEREWSGKEAGLRTNMLICVGSTLMTILSLRIGTYVVVEGPITADPSRLMAAVISGIGFLGAGTIIQARGSVTGLTTAATLWVVAGLGIAVGAQAYVIAVGTTVFVLLALIPLGQLETWLIPPRASGSLEFRTGDNLAVLENLLRRREERDLKIQGFDVESTEEGEYRVELQVESPPGKLEALPEILKEAGVKSCRLVTDSPPDTT